MAIYSNLPAPASSETQTFFDNYFVDDVSTSGSLYDAAVALFEKQAANRQAAESIATALLEAVRTQGLDPGEVLDLFKKITSEDINRYMVTVLNSTRKNSSFLGYRNQAGSNLFVSRTIRP
jgi:hypothetical protein